MFIGEENNFSFQPFEIFIDFFFIIYFSFRLFNATLKCRQRMFTLA